MTDQPRRYDTLHLGRATIDFYSNDVGQPFPAIKSFAAYVGGSPTNICVGATRLGLKTALVTGLGADPVGDFIFSFLENEGIDVGFVSRKPGYRTGATVLGIEPPDKFPMVYYRENCADIQLNIDDVLAAPIAASRILQFAGTNLSKEPSRSATMFAAEIARRAGTEVVLDLDFRPDQWHDPRAFGVALQAALPLVDIVIGTEDELNAAMLVDPAQLRLTHSQVSDARVGGDLDRAIQALLALGPRALLQKRGEAGVRLHLARPDGPAEQLDAPGFPVEIYNILGAGDAFAAGIIHGLLCDYDLEKTIDYGVAHGALTMTTPGDNSMATLAELDRLLASGDAAVIR